MKKLTGKELISFIKAHHLEDATVDADGDGFEVQLNGDSDVVHYHLPLKKEEAHRYIWTDDGDLECEDISYHEADQYVESIRNAGDKEIMLDIEVKQSVEEMTDMIFLDMQGKLGIENGDISPSDSLELDKIQDSLTEHISDVLMKQIPTKPAALTYRLYADVLMNREVNTDEDLISAGEFIMTMDGKEVAFHFCLTGIEVDTDNRAKIQLECKDPMYEYEQTAEITKKMMENISNIGHFFICTGEDGETDLRPVQLLNCAFYLPYEDIQIDVPYDVVKKACLGCNVAA